MYLVDGTAGGLMTAEIMNWTGHVLRGKREKLDVIRAREEAKRTGVYILLGEDDSGQRLAYIGQSDDVASRLLSHDTNKTFWNEVVVVTSKDLNLTSAHVRYLESRLIKLAKEISRIKLENANEPTGGAALPEADASDMDYFIEQLRILLPVLGIDLFRGREVRTPVITSNDVQDARSNHDPTETLGALSPVFVLKRNQADARAQVIDGEFTLLAGSVIRAPMEVGAYGRPAGGAESTMKQFYARKATQDRLIEEGAIELSSNGVARTTRDIQFNSPSEAGAIAIGQTSCNGRLYWKTETGQTFADWGHYPSR